MAVGKIVTATTNKLLQSHLRHKTSLSVANMVAPMVITSMTRHLSTIKLTNNLQLLTDDNRSVNVVNLKLSEPQKRPLVVILSWLMAKPKHVHKFANYYIGKGFDVLNVNTSPWQLLWPVKGSQIIAENLLHFLDINECYETILLHGFSVGGYQWGEALVKIEKNKKHYVKLTKRVVGHIWDSTADYQEIPKGVTFAMFPDNVLMQKVILSYANFHLKVFFNIATRHYIKSSQLFHADLIKSPALFLLSKADPIGLLSSNLSVKQDWEKAGIEVNWKCWDDSPHVSHYYFHKMEYINELDNFLNRIGFPAQQQQIKDT